MADYNLIRIPLDVAIQKRVLVTPGTRCGSVGIELLTSNAAGVVEMQLGDGEDWIPVRLMGRIYAPIPYEDSGINMRCLTVVPGGVVEFLVGYTLTLAS